MEFPLNGILTGAAREVKSQRDRNDGITECWSIGLVRMPVYIIPVFHHSIIPRIRPSYGRKKPFMIASCQIAATAGTIPCGSLSSVHPQEWMPAPRETGRTFGTGSSLANSDRDLSQ